MANAYESLSPRGKARHLRELAIHALDQYALEVVDIRLVGMFTNTLFRLRLASGVSYILRICRPGWRTDTDLRSEALWLQALNRDTDIGVPQPVPALDGDFIVKAGIAGVPENRRCMVLSWLPGVLLGKRLTEENLFKMGVLFARIHQQAAGFSPPPGFTQRKLDRLYPRGEEDALFGDACRAAFADCHWDIFVRTRQVVDETFERL